MGINFVAKAEQLVKIFQMSQNEQHLHFSSAAQCLTAFQLFVLVYSFYSRYSRQLLLLKNLLKPTVRNLPGTTQKTTTSRWTQNVQTRPKISIKAGSSQQNSAAHVKKQWRLFEKCKQQRRPPKIMKQLQLSFVLCVCVCVGYANFWVAGKHWGMPKLRVLVYLVSPCRYAHSSLCNHLRWVAH